jgi:hypothetical protein
VIVFFRMFTTLSGGATTPGQDVYSEVYDVTPYKSLTVEYLLVGTMGTGAAVRAQLQEGNEVGTWTAKGAEETLTAGAPTVVEYSDPARLVRVRANLRTTSGKMAATLWAIGIAREA